MGRTGGESVERLADVVRAHRHRAGLTQQELAAKAGLSLAALRDLEQGRRSRPRSGSLAALTSALNLDPRQAADLAVSAAVRRGDAAASGPDRPGARPLRGLWLAILGPVEVWLDGLPVSLGPPMRRAVLGLLALDPRAVVRRDTIIDVLWGPTAPLTAAGLVQAHVSRLRRQLAPQGDEIIVSGGGGYRLQLRNEQLDLFSFRTLVADAEAARAAGDDLAACDLYEQALTLWRDDPMSDVDVLVNQPGVTEQKRQLADVLLRYAEVACGAGLHDRVLPRLHALAATEPLNEPVHARLMIALAGAGQQAAAMRVYEDLRGQLDREFAIYPGQELVDAHLRILRQDVPVVRRPYAQRASSPIVPRQLPAVPRHFTGRSGERGMLSSLPFRASSEAGGVAVAALTGMAGIGKTALAVSWAHQVTDQFPDGQLFVNLRGFSPCDAPLAPADALGGFLCALGIPAARIPADTAGRSALYRSTLASKRVLIVLDNARNAEQVRPLLPASPGCLVLVTSRHRLTGLAAADGAHLLALGGLTNGEAYCLLTRIMGPSRAIAEPAAIGELIALCARLPLALSNAAARAAAHPRLPLATLAAEMGEGRYRLDALETGEPETSVHVVFSLSHARLSVLASGMFRMLGVYPGPEITTPAAAALSGYDQTRTRAALAELCDEHLITEWLPGRYVLHELLHAYAAEAARTQSSRAERRAAVYRLLDYYLQTASAAAVKLFPHFGLRTLGLVRLGGKAEHVASVRQAVRWAEAERPGLLAAIGLAADGGYYPHAWQLPSAAGWFFSGERCWRHLASAQEAALELASSRDDRSGAALAHYHLGWLRFWLGEHAQACGHLGRFLELANRLSDGRILLPPGLCAQATQARDGIPDALMHAGQALLRYRTGKSALTDVIS